MFLHLKPVLNLSLFDALHTVITQVKCGTNNVWQTVKITVLEKILENLLNVYHS